MSETKTETVSVSTGPIETLERQTEVTLFGTSVEAVAVGGSVRLVMRRSMDGRVYPRGSMKLTPAQALALSGQLLTASAQASAAEAKAMVEILQAWDANGDTDAAASKDGDAT